MAEQTQTMTQPLVSGFGSAVIDVLMMATHPIALQKKNPIENQTIQIGGVIPTALVVLSRLGVATELHTVFGTDTFGSILVSLLEKERVGISKIIQKPDMVTPLSSVTIHRDNGQRTSFYTTGEFSTLTDTGVVSTLSPHTTFLIADGHNIQLSREIITKAHEQNTFVMLDLGNPKQDLDSLVAIADGIIIPKAYWSTLSEKNPDVIVREFLTKGPSLVVLTMEEKGCIVGTPGNVFHQPSYEVAAVDTNGAGDVFFGSFVYGKIRGWDLKKTAEFACAAAARSCSIFGKSKKIPNSEREVYDFIGTHKLIL